MDDDRFVRARGWFLSKEENVCQCAMEKRITKLPWETIEPTGPFSSSISCPAGCACSADHPSCSCRRPAKWGGQLPRACLFPHCPKFHSAQTGGSHCTTTVLLSARDLLHTHTHTPYNRSIVSPLYVGRATSVRGNKKEKSREAFRPPTAAKCWADFNTEFNYCARWSSFINLTGNSFTLIQKWAAVQPSQGTIEYLPVKILSF